MRNWLKIVCSSVAVISLLAVTSSSYGVASFARQTGLDCNSCHAAPGFPSLNSFGAAFKAAGYTQGNEENMMGDGEGLSIPEAVNLGVVFKARSKWKMGAGGTVHDFEFPDETAVFAAGRVGQNIGFVIELGDAWFNSFKLVFAPEVGPVRIGIVPWHTDAFGAGWIFETLSTGAVRNIRIIEDRGLVSAQSATGWGGGGEASGLGLYVWHPMGFLAVTPFTQAIGGHEVDEWGYYARVAVTPSLEFGDIAVGFAYKGGNNRATAEDEAGNAVAIDDTFNWLAADFQLMMADLPLTAIITWAAATTNIDFLGVVVASTTVSYLTVALDYLVIEDVLGVTLAYRQDLSSASILGIPVTVPAGTLGESQVGGSIKYGVARNVRLSVDVHYGLTSGGIQILPMVSGSW